MKKVKAILIGAGQRGTYAYAPYAQQHPEELEFVGVAEPIKERREYFRKAYDIPEQNCFEGWEEVLEQPPFADAVLICTQDRMHYEPAKKALALGYHVLLEKPMSPEPAECIELGRLSKEHERVFSICHVLRYTPFFRTLKSLLNEGKIGQLISIQHNENVGYWHQAHSFVRGNWRNSKETSPMILAKSCHDMDILLWLVGDDCVRLSSFGDLTHFKKENAPKGAPLRCTDGCPIEKDCPYSALKIYLKEDPGWLGTVISDDPSMESRRKALEEGPYGRCVYYCDNDVVDHQVVNMEFANKVTVAFTMCAFTNEVSRTMKLMGTKGEIRAVMEKNLIEVTDFSTGKIEQIIYDEAVHGHGGGDYGIMKDFVEQVRISGKEESITSASTSVQSHLMAFAAEKSRLEGRVIDIEDF
ncbi:MAG: Gfo/Idh/MocA family oxidoreductase [Epulopiscium sp.]|nr:Gfo/Idh/MocA family oxidoreductase [Candidatus Epulonipiscium sp.]